MRGLQIELESEWKSKFMNGLRKLVSVHMNDIRVSVYMHKGMQLNVWSIAYLSSKCVFECVSESIDV